MANPQHYPLHPRKPRRVHAPSQRAQGLDPELTAQPHGLSDDIDLSGDPADLSLDPEELAQHFLTEAVEQGDLGALRADELELALEADANDAPSLEIDLGAWDEPRAQRNT